MEISKHRYFIDRAGRLVRVISEQLDLFDAFVALRFPKDPNFDNVYYVRNDGSSTGRSDHASDGDLQRDITCPLCSGKGMYIAIIGLDQAIKRPCYRCQNKGFIE